MELAGDEREEFSPSFSASVSEFQRGAVEMNWWNQSKFKYIILRGPKQGPSEAGLAFGDEDVVSLQGC